MEGNTARALRTFNPRIGHDDRRQGDNNARRGFLLRRSPIIREGYASARGVELWKGLVENHGGNLESALGELLAVLLDAGLMTEDRAV